MPDAGEIGGGAVGGTVVDGDQLPGCAGVACQGRDAVWWVNSSWSKQGMTTESNTAGGVPGAFTGRASRGTGSGKDVAFQGYGRRPRRATGRERFARCGGPGDERCEISPRT